MLNVVLCSKALPTACEAFAATVVKCQTLPVLPAAVHLHSQGHLSFFSAGEVSLALLFLNVVLITY